MTDQRGLWPTLTKATHIEPSSIARVNGPRRWWGGLLDVEWLALSSVQAAATGLNLLTGRTFSVEAERVAASFASISHLRIDGRHPESFSSMSGFHRTHDGWVRLHANYPHHLQALQRALQAQQPEDLVAALREREARDIEQLVRAAGGVAAAVRTAAEWRSSRMGIAGAAGPWIRFRATGIPVRRWEPPRDAAEAPLRGLRVLDLTRVIAGPSASRILGALGADVLRVDPPGIPELTDQHVDTGFDKRSIVLDLHEPYGLETLRHLLDDAHALVLGYRDGSLSGFEIEEDRVSIDRPGLRVVRLNAWGQEGPWKQERGFDSIVQAACGIADLYRSEDGTPGALPVQALDHATGMGVVAALSALLASDHVDSATLSLARTAHELMTHPMRPGPSTLPEVPLRSMAETAYGPLSFVPPPLHVDGQGLEYTAGPVEYGTSQPWFLDAPPDGPHMSWSEGQAPPRAD